MTTQSQTPDPSLKEENEHLKQALLKIEEAQFRIYTDRLQDAVLARFQRLALPVTLIIVVAGFLGFNSIMSQVEKSLISPQVNEIIGTEVAKEVTHQTQEYIRERLRQAELALDIKDQSDDISNTNQAIHDMYWVIAGTSAELSDIIAERENILRILSIKGVNAQKEYPNLQLIHWKRDNNPAKTLRYSLALGPFKDKAKANAAQHSAINNGFRAEAKPHYIQAATPLNFTN